MSIIKSSIKNFGLPLLVGGIYLFLYIPIIILIVFSFNNASFPAPWAGFSLKWYYALFKSQAIWRSFSISLIVALASTALSLFMSLGIVYYQFMGGNLGKFILMFYTNIIIPEIILAVGLLTFLTFLSVPLGLFTLIISHSVLVLGFVVPIVYNRYMNMDISIIESSLDLGATLRQTFFKIVLPSLTPSIIAAGLLAFIISFDNFVLSFFCAGSDAQTLSLYIYSMIRSGAPPIVNALSTFLLVLSSILVFFFCSLNMRTKIV